MKTLMTSNIFFGAALTLVAFNVGLFIKRRTKLFILNPLLVAAAIIILILTLGDIEYDSYAIGAKYIGYLLTPATVSLAIPLYEQLEVLKANVKAIIFGIVLGIVSSALSILPLIILFKLDHVDYVTLLPKSITAAFGMNASAELGGVVPITVAVIIITGMIGSIFCEKIFKLFKINHPIAKGVALGTASHALGTAKAFELGETEGAISSLALAVSGIITVLVLSFFAGLY